MSTTADRTDAMMAIEEIAVRLRDEYGAEAVVLFGSHANGNTHAYSDIDLMIIKQSSETSSFARSRKVQSLLSDFSASYELDTLVYTQEEVSGMLARGNHFVQDVILQGKVLSEDGCFGSLIELAKESYHMNPQDSEFPQYWLRIAEQDLRRVHRNFADDDPEDAGFRLQQAVEKFLKAYLIRHGWRLRRTHNLVDLLDAAVGYDPEFEHYRNVCNLVKDYYIGGRYPSDSRFPEPPDMSYESVRAAFDEIIPLIDRLREGSAINNTDD